MADLDFDGVAVAVGVQSAFGVVDGDAAAVAALTTPLTLASGCVLGDAESGDARSGIAIPNIVGVYRDVAKVAGSFTESADAFQKAEVTGFAISWVHQGNGATSTPSVGEADLSVIIPGLEAIFESAGLVGSTGGAGGEQDYNPRTGANIYTTWKLWHGDLAFVFNDCLVETLTFECTASGFVIVTANISVGTFDDTTAVDGFTFPVIDYEEMASLTGPKIVGAAFTAFGQVRGFENVTIAIANTIEKVGDSNVAGTGEKQAQTRRVITVSGTLFIAAADSDAVFQALRSGTAPTADLSFQVGTPSDDPYNAFKLEVFNVQAKDIKYVEKLALFAVELKDAKATSTTAGTEFQLTQN